MPLPELKQNAAGYWCFKAHDGRRFNPVSTKTKDRAQAEQILRAYFADAQALAERDAVAARGTTVAELVGQYIALHFEPNKKGASQRWHLKPIVEQLGRREPEDLTTPVMLAYRATRSAAGVSGPSQRSEITSLSSALRWCKDNGVLPLGRDWPRLALPADSPMRREHVTREQLDDFLAAAEAWSPRVGLYCWIAVYAGARRGVIEALTWDRIFLDAEEIDFRIPGKVATGKRAVNAPIHSRLAGRLRRAWEAAGRPRTGLVFFPSKTAPGEMSRTLRGFMRSDEVRSRWPNLHPHDLRRTAAKRLDRLGVKHSDIGNLIGVTPRVLASRYLPMATEDLRKVANLD